MRFSVCSSVEHTFLFYGGIAMNGLHRLYTNIGFKIKELATWIFVLEVVLSIAAGILIIAMSYGYIHIIFCGLSVLIVGPILSWMSTWLLYGIGVLIEKICMIERNTQIGSITLDTQRTEAGKKT